MKLLQPVPKEPQSGVRPAVREPLTDSHIVPSLENRRVCIVFDDDHFELSSKFMKDMSDSGWLPQGLKSASFSAALASLPESDHEILVVFSINPPVVVEKALDIYRALKAFREKNPDSCVVMLRVYSAASPAGSVIETLQREGVVDSIVDGPTSYLALVEQGAHLLASRKSA
ncbi:MAG: hypothetical protein AB1324_00065 [Candidatus Micrarchaeota archaeon]